MARNDLTIRQVQLLALIRNLSHLRGFPPTIRELAAEEHVSKRTIVQALNALKRKQAIRVTPRAARSIEILVTAA
jgi:SOS-response transcriptional repressor LexA